MTPSIADLIADPTAVAMTFRQTLEPVAGRDVPVFPPTYPPDRQRRTHRFDTPFPVNETRDGARVCDLDSVQSQANRMEAAFTASLADVVPHHVVRAGDREKNLLDLPHRIADAAIRATGLGDRIRACFEAFESGNAEPLARIAPTSLVYGAWDSRGTRVGVPRSVRSEIRAFDVSVLTRSVQYAGAFAQDALALGDEEWRKASDAGFAPTPSVDGPGGILVHGPIVHSATIVLRVLRRYRTAGGGEALPRYLLGLALGGLLCAARDYHLRSGCTLVPDAPGEWQVVRANGARRPIAIDAGAVEHALRSAARDWAATAGVVLGNGPNVHEFGPAIAHSMLDSHKGRGR